MLTISGAYASGQESILGSLTPDKLADLVILSANPLDVSATELLGIDVLMTMVGGNVAYCAEGQDDLCTGSPSDESGETQALFTGTWQGIDTDDGSIITVTLVQEGEALSGRFEDTFSGDVPPPGHQGDGAGAITSETTAEMHFDLMRSDGQEANLTFALALSNGNQTLTLTAGDVVIVLQRQ